MKRYVGIGIAVLASVVLAWNLSSCGGGGGDALIDRGPLTGLSISGPSTVTEYAAATYTATASWTDNSTTPVTPAWSVSPAAAIDAGGRLSCAGIDSDTTVTVTATYSSGGVTETATMDVVVTNVVTVPFTSGMVAGKVFYEEIAHAGGAYDFSLIYFHADSSFQEDWLEFDGAGGRLTGSWSIDPSGNLIVNLPGEGPFAIMLVAESAMDLQVLVNDGSGTPSFKILEKIVPFEESKLPGTYTQSPEGYTWVFNANGTGSVSIFGGVAFTWSVDSTGVLKMPTGTGYSAWFYARASSQSTSTEYTLLKVGFTEYDPGGGFYQFYGGKDLTRQ